MRTWLVSFRPYPAGEGTSVHDETYEIESNINLRDALDKFYQRPEFNPEWRVIDVREVVAWRDGK